MYGGQYTGRESTFKTECCPPGNMLLNHCQPLLIWLSCKHQCRCREVVMQIQSVAVAAKSQAKFRMTVHTICLGQGRNQIFICTQCTLNCSLPFTENDNYYFWHFLTSLYFRDQSTLSKVSQEGFQRKTFWNSWCETSFSGWMPFLSLSQWCQITKRTRSVDTYIGNTFNKSPLMIAWGTTSRHRTYELTAHDCDQPKNHTLISNM